MAPEPPRWRPARAGDAQAIAAAATAALGVYGEEAAVYAERIALAPDGCLVLERDGEMAGHFVSHPWRRGLVPKLNGMLGAIPGDADCWYIHDVVIAPQARGRGSTAAALDTIIETARAHGLHCLSLIAVGGAEHYWQRLGFTPAPDRAKGEPPAAAVYMERPV